MRVKVLKPFMCKNTKILYKKDQVAEIEKGRVDEINATRPYLFLEVIGETSNTVNKETSKIENMTKKELLEFAEEKGLEVDTRKRKEEIKEEVVAWIQQSS